MEGLCAGILCSVALTASPQGGVAPKAPADNTASSEIRIATLRTDIARMKPGPERDYFAARLAAREGRDEDAIHLFTSALPSLSHSRPDKAAMTLRLLADVYDREGRYGKSDPLYSDLEQSGLVNQLPVILRQGVHEDAELAHILANSPSQMLVWNGPVRVNTTRDNPLGLITTKLTVDGVSADWVIDTGANQTVISRSLATQLHLTMLPGVAHTSGGVTGTESPLQVALLPDLAVGGAIAHNVPLLVLEDADLTIPDGNGHQYRIAGIIGFPILRALRCVTFHHDGSLDAAANGGSATEGSPMELRMLNPVVEASIEGESFPFTLDTGAAGTVLSTRFYQRFRTEERLWKVAETKNFGAGGETTSRSFIIPTMKLAIGGRSVTLHKVSMLPTVQHADIDVFFGNIGEDLLQSMQSFTLDFVHMRFVLGAPLS